MVQKLKKPAGKFVLGLTGGFGAGKTTVGRLFQELGAKVMDADTIAHEALRPDAPVFRQVETLLKEVRRTKEGGLDRKKIAELIFRDKALKARLEAIVHPYVFERMLEEGGRSAATVIVLEIPLLFETGFHQYCHKTATIVSPAKIVEQRLLKKGFSKKDIEARQKAQFSQEEKKNLADFVIDNSGSLEATRKEVKKVWNQIRPS